ncbi:MAG: AAA family ATPase [Planctomycetes bacterium]|nr:AAA family ATPase [Planctomycetota bacterium]
MPVVRHLGTLAFHAKVTFLVGENGTGKSTLLEAIAVACDSRGCGFPDIWLASSPAVVVR